MNTGRLLLLVLLMAVSCGRKREPAEVVRPWLLCDECIEGEMDSVLALGNRAIPSLLEALRGLSARDSAGAIVQFANDHATMTKYRAEHPAPALPDPPDSATYVTRYYTALATGYQARAARALDSLRTTEATDALKSFWLTDSLRLHPAARRLVDTLVNQ